MPYLDVTVSESLARWFDARAMHVVVPVPVGEETE